MPGENLYFFLEFKQGRRISATLRKQVDGTFSGSITGPDNWCVGACPCRSQARLGLLRRVRRTGCHSL